MSREDENEFLEFLRSKQHYHSSEFIAYIYIYTNGRPSRGFAGRVYKEVLSSEHSDRPTTSRSLLRARGTYLIDGFQSPVVEFLRSFTVSGMMLPGRLQADMTYFDGDKQDLVEKPKELKKWFESMEGWIRKSYRHLTLLTYVGPGAERFREQGGLLH